jgi:hypothetical protein
MRINFYNIDKWVLAINILYGCQGSAAISYCVACPHSPLFFWLIFLCRISYSKWKNPVFQYSKLFSRCSCFRSINSNISKPTWLAKLKCVNRNRLKDNPKMSFRIVPIWELSALHSIGFRYYIKS